jgi:predicted nucleic acid-binding protein
MSDKAFVDTNILMYAHDASTGIKHERARALVEDLWRSGNGVISTQVLQELCVNLRRKTAKPVSASVARDIVTDYLAWDVQVNDAESVLDALNVQGRFKLSFWDALIVQAAERAGVSILYSEDLSDGQRYGELRVVNPLAGR